MIKLSSHLMKSKLMVVINCVGVLLMITGFVLAVFCIVQSIIDKDIIPNNMSIYLFMLLAGLCICVLPIEISNYLDDFRKMKTDIHKMTREEREIAALKISLKHSKYEFFFKIFCVALIIYCLTGIFQQYKNFKVLDTEMMEELNAMASFEDPNVELPNLLSRFYTLTSMRIRHIINFCKFVAFMLIIMLIMVFFIFPLNYISCDDKYRLELIISMWERIRGLENEVKGLKAGTHTVDQA